MLLSGGASQMGHRRAPSQAWLLLDMRLDLPCFLLCKSLGTLATPENCEWRVHRRAGLLTSCVSSVHQGGLHMLPPGAPF